MQIDILTLFPDACEAMLNVSMLARAQHDQRIVVRCINFRDYSENKHHKVDDMPYGGGAGMILGLESIMAALRAIQTNDSHVILLSPIGKQLTQSRVVELQAKYQHLIVIAGHYEGFDGRLNAHVHDIISVGDYVLTGGEIPAVLLVDAVARMIPGVIGDVASVEADSFFSGLLDYPSYTRPRVWENEVVPDVLLSGHHHQIGQYRLLEQIKTTLVKRPDLLAKRGLNESEQNVLKQYFEEKNNE